MSDQPPPGPTIPIPGAMSPDGSPYIFRDPTSGRWYTEKEIGPDEWQPKTKPEFCTAILNAGTVTSQSGGYQTLQAQVIVDGFGKGYVELIVNDPDAKIDKHGDTVRGTKPKQIVLHLGRQGYEVLQIVMDALKTAVDDVDGGVRNRGQSFEMEAPEMR